MVVRQGMESLGGRRGCACWGGRRVTVEAGRDWIHGPDLGTTSRPPPPTLAGSPSGLHLGCQPGGHGIGALGIGARACNVRAAPSRACAARPRARRIRVSPADAACYARPIPAPAFNGDGMGLGGCPLRTAFGEAVFPREAIAKGASFSAPIRRCRCANPPARDPARISPLRVRFERARAQRTKPASPSVARRVQCL